MPLIFSKTNRYHHSPESEIIGQVLAHVVIAECS